MNGDLFVSDLLKAHMTSYALLLIPLLEQTFKLDLNDKHDGFGRLRALFWAKVGLDLDKRHDGTRVGYLYVFFEIPYANLKKAQFWWRIGFSARAVWVRGGDNFRSVGTILRAICNGESVGLRRLGASDFKKFVVSY